MKTTDYTLSVLKEEKLPKSAADRIAEVVQPVEEVFRETISGGSAPKPTCISEVETAALEEEGEEAPEGEAQDLPTDEEPEGTDLV
jgi:hypothetical protein